MRFEVTPANPSDPQDVEAARLAQKWLDAIPEDVSDRIYRAGIRAAVGTGDMEHDAGRA